MEDSGSTFMQRVAESTELRWRFPLLVVIIACGIVVENRLGDYNSTCTTVGNVTTCTCPPTGEWSQIYWYSAVLIFTAQMSWTVKEFFKGEGPTVQDQMTYFFFGVKPKPTEVAAREEVGFWTLMPSAMISWIFAKSINNAASWGGKFGVMGGVAYAGWYTSFWTAGLVGYWLRTRFGFRSLPAAVERCYGPLGLLCLNIALLFRLWNEIWSNVQVVASFYSADDRTRDWWIAAIVSAAVPAVYVCMGGMRASLFSDVVQAAFSVFLLVYLLGVSTGIISSDTVRLTGTSEDVFSWEPTSGYQSASSALVAALLQGFFSYPFHDPVLTDRTFLAKPRVMLASFFVGGAIAGMFIVLFSAVGILGDFLADPPNGIVGRGSPAAVARALCGVTFGLMNLIMMTTSLSTIDSTYTSVTKLVSLEFFGFVTKCRPLSPDDPSVGKMNILLGRLAIIVLGVAGVAYLNVTETEVIQATTVSGTMVSGLGPPILMLLVWKYNSAPGATDGWRKAPLAFFFSFVPGCVLGSAYLVSGFKVKPAGATEPCTVSDYPLTCTPLYTGAPNGTTIYRNPALRHHLLDWGDKYGQVGDRVGPYDMFLAVNWISFLLCWAGCLFGLLLHQLLLRPISPPTDGEPTIEHPLTGERIVRAGFEREAEAAEMGDGVTSGGRTVDTIEAREVEMKEDVSSTAAP